YKTGPNMGNYNARFYEGRYLTGVIAGKMTKSNILGYVAAFPIPGVLQGVNAFALGARSVNPEAEGRVSRVNSWSGPGSARAAGKTLYDGELNKMDYYVEGVASKLPKK